MGPSIQPELLERRTLLAGNVLVYWRGGDLVIKGDDAANSIEINRSESCLAQLSSSSCRFSIQVKGTNGTTINGGAHSFSANYSYEETRLFDGSSARKTNAEGDPRVENLRLTAALSGGNDQVAIAGNYNRGLAIDLGSGDDELLDYRPDGLSLGSITRGVSGKSMQIIGGNGNDRVNVFLNDIAGNVVLDTGLGNNQITLAGRPTMVLSEEFRKLPRDDNQVAVAALETGPFLEEILTPPVGQFKIPTVGQFKIQSRSGADNIQLINVKVGGQTLITTGHGNDSIDMRDVTFGGAVRIDFESGDDTIKIDHGTFKSQMSMNGGAGKDSFSLIDSVFSGDVVLSAGSGDNSGNIWRSTFEKRTLVEANRGNDVLKTDTSRFNGPTKFHMGTGQDALDIGKLTRFHPGFPLQTDGLSLTAGFSGTGVVRSGGTFVTRNSKLPLTGLTTPGATVSVDVDQDGIFDDGLMRVGRNGQYNISIGLRRTAADEGEKTISVKTVLNGDTRIMTVDVYVAAGSIVQFRTNVGAFDVELFNTDTPLTVGNFLEYVSAGAYDNLLVHRSVENFVVHTGGFSVSNGRISTVVAGPAIPNEFSAKHSNLRGTLSMAHPGNPDLATSQWFINVVANPFLDSAKHTVFGRVIGEGMAVVDRINKLKSYDLNGAYASFQLGEVPLNRPLPNGTVITGKVSATAYSRSVTGTGTRFKRDLKVGNSLLIDGRIYFVASIRSNTSLELTTPVRQSASQILAKKNVAPADSDFVVFSDIRPIL